MTSVRVCLFVRVCVYLVGFCFELPGVVSLFCLVRFSGGLTSTVDDAGWTTGGLFVAVVGWLLGGSQCRGSYDFSVFLQK